jgi:two-component sensor histidine kinase
MIVHELTTNAVKYAALSNMSGSVRVSWSTKQNGKMRSLYFRWLERGRPKVVSPERKGFGTSRLKSAVHDIRIDYGEDGLSCEFNLPLGNDQF